MGVPTPEELEQALAEARRLREEHCDEHFLGKSLLNLNYRIHLLEAVHRAAQHYLRSGLGPHEHAELMKAMAAVEKASLRAGTEREEFGLE